MKELILKYGCNPHQKPARIYTSAGELPIEGINKTSLVDGLRAHGHKDARVLGGPDDLPKIIREIAQPGDYVVFLGAGSITYWANEMPAKLAAGG